MSHLLTSLGTLAVLSTLVLTVGCADNSNSVGSSSEAAATAEATQQTTKQKTAQTATEEAAIQKLYADWRVAVEGADIPGYLGVLHSDVRLFPPGAAPIVGAAGYGEFLVPVFASATYRIEVVKLQEVQVMGDIAVAEYEYVIHITLKDPDSTITQPGALTGARNRARYFDVLRKQEDGRWGIWRHLWQDLPLEAQ